MPRKTVVNHAPYAVSLNLYVREGLEPGRVHTTVSVRLAPGAAALVDYGDYRNPMLEGLELTWVQNGARMTHRKVVAIANTPWDEALNRHNGLLIHGLAELEAAPLRLSADAMADANLGKLLLAG